MFIDFIQSGGFAMYPLLICSLVVWGVIFERLWRYRKLSQELKTFHFEAMNALLQGETRRLKDAAARYPTLPTSRLVSVALDRLEAKDKKLRKTWHDAVERKRSQINLELRQNLWLLGTIGAASPFIGLFGTVVGILRSFKSMAQAGSGGFAVVAAGISESLIATAGGIVVAVIAVMAYNAFQTRWSGLVLTIRVHSDELSEILNLTEMEDGT